MRRYKFGAVLTATLLSVGCAATTPEDAADDGQPAAIASVGVNAGGTPAEEPAASPTATPGATVAMAGVAEISPDLIIDLNEQPPTDYSEVICRQMLKPGSNVIVNQCMTRPDWKLYDRAEARWAQDTLLRMQGSFR